MINNNLDIRHDKKLVSLQIPYPDLFPRTPSPNENPNNTDQSDVDRHHRQEGADEGDYGGRNSQQGQQDRNTGTTHSPATNTDAYEQGRNYRPGNPHGHWFPWGPNGDYLRPQDHACYVEKVLLVVDVYLIRLLFKGIK